MAQLFFPDSSQDIVSVTQNLEDITMEETEWEF